MGISSIGSGKDYSTISSWEDAIDASAFSEDMIGEIYGAPGDTGNVTFSGINTNGYQCILRAASGQEAVFTYGLRFSETTNVLNVLINGIEFHTGGYILCDPDNNDSAITITKCVFRDSSAGVVNIDITSSGAIDANIGVCLFRNLAYVPIWNRDADATVNLANCTLYGNNYGVYWTNNFTYVKNVVSMNNTQADFKTTIANATYCCDEDSSLPTATGNLKGKTAANQFVDPAADNYRVQDTAADIYHAGTPIADSWFPVTDLVGTIWNNPPSIGCFEYVGEEPPVSASPQMMMMGMG